MNRLLSAMEEDYERTKALDGKLEAGNLVSLEGNLLESLKRDEEEREEVLNRELPEEEDECPGMEGYEALGSGSEEEEEEKEKEEGSNEEVLESQEKPAEILKKTEDLKGKSQVDETRELEKESVSEKPKENNREETPNEEKPNETVSGKHSSRLQSLNLAPPPWAKG